MMRLLCFLLLTSFSIGAASAKCSEDVTDALLECFDSDSNDTNPCSVHQEMVTCLEKPLDTCPYLFQQYYKKMYGLRFVSLKYSGCSLKFGDVVKKNITGCNFIEAQQCLTPIHPLFEQASRFNLFLSAIEDIGQETLCHNISNVNSSTVNKCLKKHASSCPKDEVFRDFFRTRRSGFTYNLDFRGLSTLRGFEAFCSPGCKNIDAKVAQINICLSKVDRDQVAEDADCIEFKKLVDCVKKQISGCSILQSNWIQFIKYDLMADVPGICALSLGTEDCLEREEQEDDVRMCFEDFSKSKLSLCGSYTSLINCVNRNSLSCRALNDTYIRPQYLHLSAVNKMFSCDLKYGKKRIQVVETAANCSIKNYTRCFNSLTSALGVPQFNESSVETMNTFANLRDFIANKTSLCRQLDSVNLNSFETCIKQARSGCGLLAPPAKLHWAFEPETVKNIIKSTCQRSCKFVNVENVLRECKYDASICKAAALSSFFSKGKSDCTKVMDLWNCINVKVWKCDYAIDVANKHFNDTCLEASEECFGKVLKITAWVDKRKNSGTKVLNSIFLVLMAAGFTASLFA